MLKRTRVKICGIRDIRDAVAAVDSGADAIGFVFHDGSSRYISPEKAAEIIRQLPPYITTVGLCVDMALDRVNTMVEALKLDLVQLHGDESAEYCRALSHPFIKVIPGTTSEEIEARAQDYPDSRGIMLDTSVAGQFGGTGQTFDWRIVPDLSRPVVLAGGLTADNVADAIKMVRPYSVDVSGGVEISRGQKDAAKMSQFVSAVQRADKLLNEQESI